ncbi:energy transducer TonB [Acetobacter indonesiensis]|uniref:energy transducer TonB n=1 Tax=Acetobacter indonesiensis TaxID=104101 RepID=UPI000A3823A8|nr:energy transducer TonB [Acetobacter indonesiensis]MCG0994802.1 energy transducer TonB [Acetobacter indonesiensis]MCI1437787.1 energy transducer TonB [Acetobacter indonesiensis]MCI1546673.1 energy transducer TonB [Acetobacter indonesiensis]MCI1766025.1 energy transducer TonB [Acetobacter indonesiensis]MCP1230045.1 energy transducer TonB [Acetobacter indonesiensis]
MVRPRRSEQILLRRSLYLSGGAHIALLLALLLSLPAPKPPEEPPPVVEMQFESADSGGSTAKADKPSPTPAPPPAPVPNDAPPTPEPPKPVPNEEAPPPPPPPQPVPPPPVPQAEKLPDTPIPPKADEPSPDVVKTPPSPPSPPKATPSVAPPSPVTEPTDTLPETPIPSHITQPNKAKKTQADTHSLLETLDSFRSDQKQTHAPTAKANPTQGGAPNGGGSPTGDITRSLSVGEQKAIGGAVRRCYTEDTAAKNYATFVAHLIVTVDAAGEARIVQFAPQTQAQMNADSSYRALAERARAAVLSPTCSKLPIPKNLLGQTRQLKFVFRP